MSSEDCRRVRGDLRTQFSHTHGDWRIEPWHNWHSTSLTGTERKWEEKFSPLAKQKNIFFRLTAHLPASMLAVWTTGGRWKMFSSKQSFNFKSFMKINLIFFIAGACISKLFNFCCLHACRFVNRENRLWIYERVANIYKISFYEIFLLYFYMQFLLNWVIRCCRWWKFQEKLITARWWPWIF